MDWLTFCSNVINSLAWPATIITIFFIVRKPIIELLPYLKNLKIYNLQVEFNKQIVEATNLAKEANLPTLTDTIESTEPSVPNAMNINVSNCLSSVTSNDYVLYLYRLAEESPRSSIIESWLLVEKSVRELATQKNIYIPAKSSALDILRIMITHELLPSEIHEIIDHLRLLRNKSVHETEFELQPKQAREYVELSLRVISALAQK